MRHGLYHWIEVELHKVGIHTKLGALTVAVTVVVLAWAVAWLGYATVRALRRWAYSRAPTIT